MFRSISRVVVVAVVVLSLTVVLVPTVQAGPRDAGGPAVKAASGWIQTALAWLTRVVTGQEPRLRSLTAAGKRTPTSGSCIDPMGQPCDNLP